MLIAHCSKMLPWQPGWKNKETLLIFQEIAKSYSELAEGIFLTFECKFIKKIMYDVIMMVKMTKHLNI